MARDLHPDTQEAMSGAKLFPILLVQLMFASGAFRMWTGIGDITWNAATWSGLGTLGAIGPVEETSELRSVGLDLELSGIPVEVIDIALADEWQSREATIYYAVLDEEGRFVGEPFELFSGLMDQMQSVEGSVSSIRLTCESDEIDLERTKVRRYTPEDQRAEYPGDKFCDAVAAVQEVDVKWGRGFEKDT